MTIELDDVAGALDKALRPVEEHAVRAFALSNVFAYGGGLSVSAKALYVELAIEADSLDHAKRVAEALKRRTANLSSVTITYSPLYVLGNVTHATCRVREDKRS